MNRKKTQSMKDEIAEMARREETMVKIDEQEKEKTIFDERREAIEMDRIMMKSEVRQDIEYLLKIISDGLYESDDPFQDDNLFKLVNTVKNLFHFVALSERNYKSQFERVDFDESLRNKQLKQSLKVSE